MKAFLAYFFLIVGIPNYVGAIAGALCMPLAWPFADRARLTVIQLLNFPKGIISISAAKLMFYLFGVSLHWSILAISVVWITAYYLTFKQPKIGWISFTAGLILGWFISLVK